MVRFLLDNGATLDSKNKSGYTALTIAESWGFTEIVRIIKDATEGRRKLAAEKARRDAEKARCDAANALAAQRQERLKRARPSTALRPK